MSSSSDMGTTFQQQSTLMGVPLEIRNQILGHLLPNLSEIKVFDGYHDNKSVPNAPGVEWLEPDVSLRVAQLVKYRGDGEACHTAILRASRQLYIEGATIMYNRAFQVVVGAGVLTFLRRRYHWDRAKDSFPDSRQLYTFPFHLAKQIQIEVWATNFYWSIRDLTHAMLDLCLVLHEKPSLRSVRVDLWDRQHRPVPSSNRSDCMVDGAGPCPLQEKFRGRIFSKFSDGGCFPLDYDQYRCPGDVWEHVVPFWSMRYDLVWPPASDGLKEALEPLKLLRNVGTTERDDFVGTSSTVPESIEAGMLETALCMAYDVSLEWKINLTAHTEKDHGMVTVAKKIEDSTMSYEPHNETDLTWMDRFYFYYKGERMRISW